MHGGNSEEMLVLQGFRGSNKYKICLTLLKKSSDFTTTTALAQGFCGKPCLFVCGNALAYNLVTRLSHVCKVDIICIQCSDYIYRTTG